MPRYDTPEMLRLSLDAVVLKVKMLGIRTAPIVAPSTAPKAQPSSGDAGAGAGGAKAVVAAPAPSTGSSAKAVLKLSLQSPDDDNVDVALTKLAALGALTSADDDAEVTPFGRLLAAFPGDMSLGKMIAVGVTMGGAATADAIVLAAAIAAGDVFLM